MEISIYIGFSVVGCHRFPGAKLEALRTKHFHTFSVSIVLEEKKSRQIEWIEFRDWVQEKLAEKYQRKDGLFDFETKSCESIAREIAKIVSERYTGDCMISVSEADENCGTEVYFTDKEMEAMKNESGCKGSKR